MNKNNGTQVMVEFEDWSERPQLSRADLEREIKRLRGLAGAYFDQKRRADVAEDECLRLHRRLERIPSRIRSFFDRIHRIRRAWQYVTNVTSQA